MYILLLKFVNLRSIPTCRNHFNRERTSLRKKSSIFSLVESMSHDKASGFHLKLTDKLTDVRVQVVGSGAAGAPGSVLVKTSFKNYLINCGEGTQKLAGEYKIKLSKSPDIFITSPTWKNVSGLLGMALTLQDSNVSDVKIHGHTSIGSIFSTVNKFTNLRHLHTNIINCSHDEDYTDGFISVKYVLLHSSSSVNAGEKLLNALTNKKNNSESESEVESSSADESSYLSEGTKSEGNSSFSSRESKRIKKANKEKEIRFKTLHTEPQRKPATSFIFSIKKTPGTLNLEKCLELGVPAGPLLGDLKYGKDVTLPNGTTVKSADVRGPDLPGVVIIAVECPSEEYLNSLLNESIFYGHQQLGDNVAAMVIHFSSSQIVKNKKYRNWINRFPKETKHLFINEDNKLTGSVAVYRQQFKLNIVAPDLFPLLPDAGIPFFPRLNVADDGHSLVPVERDKNVQIYSDSKFYKCDTDNFIKGETMCTVYLKPKMIYDYSKCLVLKRDEFLQEVYQYDVKEKIENCKETLEEIRSQLESDNRIYPKIVFLGTGSGKPSKVRNASGILIFIEEDKCILFDCGESTYNQLIRYYGRRRTREILRNLRAVFVSHLHVDHHFGLATILKERKAAFDKLNESSSEASSRQTTDGQNLEFKPIFLLAPLQLIRWLQLYNDEFDSISDLYELLGNNFLHDQSVEKIRALVEACEADLNLKSISTVPVCHCPNAYGISVVHEDGWKITYSGDTRPCEDLVKLGMNSDILIHEATFEDAFKSQAKQKLHSTTNEALDVGKRMNAKYILLTHFSQRYCYLPNIEEELSQLNIGVAFDFMEVPYNKLPILPALLTPLKYIFAEFDEKIKLTAKTAQIKRERSRSVHVAGPKIFPADYEKPAKISKML